MISLKQPALALNSFDVPGYEFSMWATWKMPRNMTPRDVVHWILYACDQSPELRLNHVVINSHGKDGKVLIGADANGYVSINNYNVGVFSELRNKDIGTIWFTACELAKSGIGKYLCAEVAKNAKCDVVAANVIQEAWPSIFGSLFMSAGNIDDYEGKVYRWNPRGEMEAFFPNGKTF